MINQPNLQTVRKLPFVLALTEEQDEFEILETALFGDDAPRAFWSIAPAPADLPVTIVFYRNNGETVLLTILSEAGAETMVLITKLLAMLDLPQVEYLCPRGADNRTKEFVDEFLKTHTNGVSFQSRLNVGVICAQD